MTPRQAAEPLRVGMSRFCTRPLQSIFGAFPENHSCICSAFFGFSFAHISSAAWRSATIFLSSVARSSQSFCTSGKILNGSSGSPPRFFTVFVQASPPNGAPCVLMLFSQLLPSACSAPFAIIVLPIMSVGRFFSLFADTSASRIASGLLPSISNTFHPHARYFIPVSSFMTAPHSVES